MEFRSRIVKHERVRASALVPHPLNTRAADDPEQVRRMAEVLEDVGQIVDLVVRPLNGGYQIIDGHLRAGMAEESEVDVGVTDLSDAEAEKAILALNKLAAMRQDDQAKLLELLNRQEDLRATGFDAAERDELAALLAAPEKPVVLMDDAAERESPSRVVACPKCGFEFGLYGEAH